MPAESDFVGVAKEVADRLLEKPTFLVRQGAALLYQVTVNNKLELTVNPARPVRGDSAFQTDLCIFQNLKNINNEEISIPRVVLEFKTRITTHDVLTYSAKAAKHKQVYPYLRYGIVAEKMSAVPGRLFTHNQSLDFCACVAELEGEELENFFSKLLRAEIETSRLLEDIAFGSIRTRLFRNEVLLNK